MKYKYQIFETKEPPKGFLIADIRLGILRNFKGLLYPVGIVVSPVYIYTMCEKRSRLKGGDPPTADG